MSQTFIMQTFLAQIAKTTKISITRKPYNKFLHTDNFQFIPAFKCLYPAKTAKNSYSAKSKITYTAKKKKQKSHSVVIPIQMFFLILPKTT